MSHGSVASLLVGIAAALTAPSRAQQPVLVVAPHTFGASQPAAALQWLAYGPVGDVFVLVAEPLAGRTNVFGATFDLAFGGGLLPLAAGVLQPTGNNGSVPLIPSALPPGVPLFLQYGAFDAAAGLGSLRASQVESFAVHAGNGAIVVSFQSPGTFPQQMTGVFDHTVADRLQASPPATRTVRPLPPEAYVFPLPTPFAVLHAAGSRFQLAFRAVDLGANGLPERLTAIRWRPLFGNVVPELHPQFELLAAHSDAVPDYTIDTFSALPVNPLSGLSAQFAANPIGGSATSIYSGPYNVQPAALLPSGYVPFPALPQGFGYDGVRTLLLETRCAPSTATAVPVNHGVIHQMVPTSPFPYAMVYASAGWNGQPTPLQPTAVTTGTGGSFLFDWELEFVRTESLATSQWQPALTGAPDYLPPIRCEFTPPGTSIALEFRGASDGTGNGATPWSASQDVADGKPYLQFRVRMVANAATGAVPWLDTLIVPWQ